jgi:hypothetical protein
LSIADGSPLPLPLLLSQPVRKRERPTAARRRYFMGLP